jgi:hypothetical protein
LFELGVAALFEHLGDQAVVRVLCCRQHKTPYVAFIVMWRPGSNSPHCLHPMHLDAT